MWGWCVRGGVMGGLWGLVKGWGFGGRLFFFQILMHGEVMMGGVMRG